MKHPSSKRKTLAMSALLSSVVAGAGARADDVEVYVTPPSDPVAPNVLFVLDESGSMGWSNPTRMSQLKQAMTTVLEDTNNDNINAGILAYTTRRHPTRVVHDFGLIKDERSAMVDAVEDLEPLGGTPTIHALASAVKWYESGFRGKDSPIPDDPAGNWCKTNYIVFLSDGDPNSNRYEVDLGGTLELGTNPDEYRSETCGNDSNGGPLTNPFTGNGAGGSCAGEIGNWAFDTDLKTGGKWDWDPADSAQDPANKRIQNIVIHTIGMAMKDSANPTGRELFMKYVAQEGGGKYFPAGNAAQLTAAFQMILKDAQLSIPYTYTAPTVPFDQNNTAVSGKDIYVPLFEPGIHPFWYGNIKKYEISYEPSVPGNLGSPKVLVLEDSSNTQKPVLDADYKLVKSIDFWNSSGQEDGYDPSDPQYQANPNGSDPLKGGAASNLSVQSPAKRNLYTWLGSNDDLTASANLVTRSNTALNDSILGDLDDNADLDELDNGARNFTTRKNRLLDWLTWAADLTLPDGNGGTVTVSHKNEMGAPLHPKPVVLRANGEEVVFISTTEGILHALDAEKGTELWAFMPRELLKTVADAFVSDWNAAKPHDPNTGEPIPPNDHGHVTTPMYGLDGPLMTYTTDVVYQDNDHDGVPDLDAQGDPIVVSQGKTYLLMGMRRGGRNYYVLDVTDPLKPRFAWWIEGGKGDFADLGQTWSKPVFTKVQMNGGNTREVLIFGGGYDKAQDKSYIDNDKNGVFDKGTDTPVARSADSLGKVIYFVDPKTGSYIDSIDDSDMVEGDMDNAIASDILPVDINADGITDRLYAAGVGGRIIRVDIPDKALSAITGNSDISATVLADVNLDSNGSAQGGEDFQRFFNTPEVAYYSKGGIQYLALMIASGHRPQPLSAAVDYDRFYMIKDPNVWTAPPDLSPADGKPDYPDLITEGDLYNATENLIQDGATQVIREREENKLKAAKGWYINLTDQTSIASNNGNGTPNSGQKGFSSAKVYDYAVLFTTYSGTRSPNTDACDALHTQGESRFYALDMTNGTSIFSEMDGNTGLSATDRSKFLKIPGMPPAPSLMFPKATDANGNAKLGGEVLAIVGLQEVARWPDRFHPISWEEVIDD